MSSNSTLEQEGEAIFVPDAPQIPGLRFRHFRGDGDYPLMVEVLNDSRATDGVEEVSTVERLSGMYSKLKNSDLSTDLLIVEVGGEVVGYTRVEWQEELDGTRIYFLISFLRPRWRGQGIEKAQLHWAESRLRDIASGHPKEAARFYDTFAVDVPSNAALIQTLKSEGYEAIRYAYDMVRPNLEDIPAVPLPEGVEVRPVDKTNREQMHQIWAAEVEAFKDHWGETTHDESDFERWDMWGNFQPELWQVAWEGDEVVGMVRNFIDRDLNASRGIERGYTENISVRRPWRRKGVARALIARSFKMLKDMGMTEAALGVDASNPNGARQLYESMGFQTVRQHVTFRKPMQ